LRMHCNMYQYTSGLCFVFFNCCHGCCLKIIFSIFQVHGHTSCMTEAEKYQGNLYRGPKKVCLCLFSSNILP
jgi:hypothetical protein